MHRAHLSRFMAVAGIIIMVGCAAKQENEGPTVRFVTFNAGLARGLVAHTEERAPLVAKAVAALPAHAVCVQEFWSDDHLEELKSEAQANLANVVARPAEANPEGSTTAACALGELDDVYTCAMTHCADAGDQITTCMFTHCAATSGGLTGGCQSCILSNVAQPIPTIRATCETSGGGFAFGGSYGTALLTSLPVLEEDSLPVEAVAVRRGVLYAKLASVFGNIHVFCTHLAAIFPSIPYSGELGSWEAEQSAQIDAMRAWVESKAGGEPAVILGDMNTGPDETPENYTKLMTGLRNPYTESGAPLCSFCAENPLVGGDSDGLIDHVLLGNMPAARAGAARVLDQPLVLESVNRKTTRYSDHYGILVELRSL